MKLPNIKSQFETVGVIAIVVSLLLLTYEVKRANEIAEAEATSAVYEMGNELMLAVASDQFLRQALIRAGGNDFEALTYDEKMLLNGWFTYVLNLNEVAWKYNQLGLMSDEDLRIRNAELCKLIGDNSTFSKFWKHRSEFALPGFYHAVDEACKLEVK